MSVYHLKRELELDCRLDQLFAFFADAGNLEQMTPPWLHFQILSDLPIEMREDALIRYRLRLHGIPIQWTTRISAWQPPYRFVDEQISGPFRQWVHEHTFEETASGTIARDHVQYQVPGGFLVHGFVRRDLEKIFDFRTQRLRKLEQNLGECV